MGGDSLNPGEVSSIRRSNPMLWGLGLLVALVSLAGGLLWLEPSKNRFTEAFAKEALAAELFQWFFSAPPTAALQTVIAPNHTLALLQVNPNTAWQPKAAAWQAVVASASHPWLFPHLLGIASLAPSQRRTLQAQQQWLEQALSWWQQQQTAPLLVGLVATSAAKQQWPGRFIVLPGTVQRLKHWGFKPLQALANPFAECFNNPGKPTSNTLTSRALNPLQWYHKASNSYGWVLGKQSLWLSTSAAVVPTCGIVASPYSPWNETSPQAFNASKTKNPLPALQVGVAFQAFIQQVQHNPYTRLLNQAGLAKRLNLAMSSSHAKTLWRQAHWHSWVLHPVRSGGRSGANLGVRHLKKGFTQPTATQWLLQGAVQRLPIAPAVLFSSLLRGSTLLPPPYTLPMELQRLSTPSSAVITLQSHQASQWLTPLLQPFFSPTHSTAFSLMSTLLPVLGLSWQQDVLGFFTDTAYLTLPDPNALSPEEQTCLRKTALKAIKTTEGLTCLQAKHWPVLAVQANALRQQSLQRWLNAASSWPNSPLTLHKTENTLGYALQLEGKTALLEGVLGASVPSVSSEGGKGSIPNVPSALSGLQLQSTPSWLLLTHRQGLQQFRLQQLALGASPTSSLSNEGLPLATGQPNLRLNGNGIQLQAEPMISPNGLSRLNVSGYFREDTEKGFSRLSPTRSGHFMNK